MDARPSFQMNLKNKIMEFISMAIVLLGVSLSTKIVYYFCMSFLQLLTRTSNALANIRIDLSVHCDRIP